MEDAAAVGAAPRARVPNGDAFYLHDGRASTLADAIDAHGGEAEVARNTFIALDEDSQEAVLAFLESL